MKCGVCDSCLVNINTDEAYCDKADGREIFLRQGQGSPTWCPLKAERKEKITIEDALEAWQRIRNMFKKGEAYYVVLLNPRLIDAAIEALKNQTAEGKEE